MELHKIQVVEYSVSQGCYHSHSLPDMLSKNLKSVMEERVCDYVPIGIFDSQEKADNFIEWHREKMEWLKKANKLKAV